MILTLNNFALGYDFLLDKSLITNNPFENSHFYYWQNLQTFNISGSIWIVSKDVNYFENFMSRTKEISSVKGIFLWGQRIYLNTLKRIASQITHVYLYATTVLADTDRCVQEDVGNIYNLFPNVEYFACYFKNVEDGITKKTVKKMSRAVSFSKLRGLALIAIKSKSFSLIEFISKVKEKNPSLEFTLEFIKDCVEIPKHEDLIGNDEDGYKCLCGEVEYYNARS